MTLMFTHKANGAWDALTKSLVEAGFVITASWPINPEAEGSLHIKHKSAAKSTIFLVCRVRANEAGETRHWEDIEPDVAAAVRRSVRTCGRKFRPVRRDFRRRPDRHQYLDVLTKWFILAWGAFRAPRFPVDEAMKLARVVGFDLDLEPSVLRRAGEL